MQRNRRKRYSSENICILKPKESNKVRDTLQFTPQKKVLALFRNLNPSAKQFHFDQDWPLPNIPTEQPAYPHAQKILRGQACKQYYDYLKKKHAPKISERRFCGNDGSGGRNDAENEPVALLRSRSTDLSASESVRKVLEKFSDLTMSSRNVQMTGPRRPRRGIPRRERVLSYRPLETIDLLKAQSDFKNLSLNERGVFDGKLSTPALADEMNNCHKDDCSICNGATKQTKFDVNVRDRIKSFEVIASKTFTRKYD